METVVSCRPLLLRFKWACAAIAAALGSCLTCLLLLAGSAHALDPNKRLTQYLHTSWRIQDGSAPSGMYAITQTSDGFLWLLSSRGEIYRFDGIQFLRWHLPADAESIGRTRNIVADGGGLWVLGADGIAHLKNGVVTSHFQLNGLEANPLNISQDTDGSIWVVRGDNGIAEPVCHVSEQAMKCYGKSDGIPISPIDAILADGKGGFWLGGQAALVHWHAGASEMYPIKGLKAEMGAPGVMSLARGPDGSVWVGIFSDGPGRGLARFEEGTVKSFVTPAFDGSKVTVFALRFDRDGNLWAGTANDGVLRIHGEAVDHYQRTEGLSGDFVRAFFEDREGIVWTATNNGVDRFHDSQVTTLSAVEGLARDNAVGILASREGTIWVANAYSLDHVANGTVSSIRTGHGLPGQQVSSLLEDHTGRLWVGVDDGLYLFKNGGFRRLPARNHQPLGLVFGLAEDSDGNIWAVCAGTAQLVRIGDFRVQEAFTRAQIPAARIAPNPQGGIWIATHKGELGLLRHGALRKFLVNPDAKDSLANQIIGQPDGSVLAAFDNGLVGLRQDKVQRMTTKNGLPCDEVISFVQDGARRWWLNTHCGIVEFSDSELQRWWANPNVVIQTRVYDVLEGARPSARPPFNSAAISADGRVWFVNSGVVQVVDPSSLSQKALPAETYIDSLIADRKEFAAAKNLKVPPHPRDVQIDYTSPTLLIPQRVKFRYRLDGYDRDWHDAGTRRQAFYTDLPPGKYSFRVIACNSDGVWNDSATRLDFYVAPAYYQTNWFRALCAIFFLALLWAAYRWRVRQLHHQFEMTLDARVSERTRIARELHDTLLQSFHGLLFRFQAARNMLPNRPEEATQALDTALIRAEQALDESRHSIQGLRPSLSAQNDLDQMLITTGQELASSNHAEDGSPRFEVIVEGERRPLPPMIKDEIARIARELLRNAFRHAHAHEIEVEIRYESDVFRLIVRDDGKGMDPKILKDGGRAGHWGLPGVQERARGIGARLEFWSEAGAGAEIRLTLPADIAYERPRNGDRFSLFRKRRIHEHQS
jgi:signal transduction histidine kinase/ligand-binding sensor domain-containing protein